MAERCSYNYTHRQERTAARDVDPEPTTLRLLATLSLLFVGTILLMGQVFGNWRADAYSALVWVANVLAFG